MLRILAARAVAVAIEVVDVVADHLNRARDILRTIAAAAGAVDI